MIRKFVLLLAALGMLSTIPACTSKGSGGEDEILAEDGTSEELAGLALDEGGDGGFAESGDGNDLSLDLDTSVADTASEDQLTIDSFGEGTDMTNMDLGAEPVPEPGATEEPLAPEPMDLGTSDMAATDTTNEMMAPPADEITPPTTTTLDEAPPAYMADSGSEFQETTNDDKPKNIPVQKVVSEPWKSGSKWVNAIYFARPGDTLESISQAIYGDDRTSELKRINPTFKRRGVRPGDKVYYASAIRPDDNGKVLTYFEEKNIPSQSYVAKSGDNIRKVSRELLGYPEAWKEVWSYNPGVESKQEIAEGTELRYWDSNAHLGGGAPSPLAEMAPSGNSNMPPVEDMGTNDLPPPPPMPEMGDMGQDSMAQNDFAPPPDLPPPPDMEGGPGMGGMNTADLPPPPPPMDLPPPPPPPPPVQAAQPPVQASVDDGAMADQDQTVMMGAVAAGALMLVALMVVRRKRKQKELEQALGETHVG